MCGKATKLSGEYELLSGQNSECEISGGDGMSEDKIPDVRYPEKVEWRRDRIPDGRYPEEVEWQRDRIPPVPRVPEIAA